MNQSKERNLSKSKERNISPEERSPTFSDSHLVVECPLHSRNYLTNICVSEGCFEPLCPECVSTHIDLHNELRTNAKVETLSTRRQETLKNLTELLVDFQNEKKKLIKHSDQQRNEIAQHYFNKISKAKAKILQIIEGYFETLNNEVRKDMDEHYKKHPGEFTHLNGRLDNIIGTLQKQMQNLKTANYVKTMLKFQTATLHQDYSGLKRQIDDAIEAYTSDIKKVVLDESKLYSLNVELNKFIQLKGTHQKDLINNASAIDDKFSLVEKAFAIHDITNDLQNYSRFSNFYENSPQKTINNNLSNYNFSESKIKEYKGNSK